MRVRDVFDEWAESGRADGMERGHGPTAKQAFDALGVSPNYRFLDIGCGNGYVVRWAAQTAPSVDAVGIDVSAHMVALARQLTTGQPNARYRRGSFPQIDLSRAQFDAIFSMEVFYYLSDLDAGLQAVRDLLAPGGSFACVVDFYRENADSHSWPEDLGVDMHLLSAAEWCQAFERAGLEVADQRRLYAPKLPGMPASWKHTTGSLFTLGRRPSASR
ncbi:class I SAM-dependent methyltransferase [Haliangium ochraceum]|uniref:class I SAM-dependent methyltransferase n=1 Tax=Haliangium ochraceum TaxID=80816 RepID=UPI0018EF93DE|nr:class I SAM-dependent methyltransferase [Haliangium ochraceum]